MRSHKKWAFVGGLLLAGCGCGEGGRARDANPTDAAAADAARDATTARQDAAPDSGPVGAGWVALPGLPDGCVIERAERPEVLFEMSWEPCERGLAGCEQMVGTVFSSGYHDGEQGYLKPVIGDRNAHSRVQIDVLTPIDGPPLGAWRYDLSTTGGRNCFANPFSVGGGRAAFGVFWRMNGAFEHRVYADDLDAIRFADTPIAVLGSDLLPGGSFTQLGVSRDMTVAKARSVMIITPQGAREMPPIPGLPGSVEVPPLSVVGSDVFWSDWTNYVRIAHASVDEDTELFLEVEDGGDVRDFRADGADMAWLEAYWAPNGYEYDRIELWTAPYTNDPSRIVPRKIADLPAPSPVTGVLGGGYYAFERELSPDPRQWNMVLYRLSDGKRGVVSYPEGFEIHPIYVAAHELVAVAGLREARIFRSSLDSVVFE